MTAAAKQTRSTLTPPASGACLGVSKRAKANAFPKSARLLKHPGFQQVYDKGRRQFSGSMTFFYILTDGATSQKDDAPSLSPSFAGRVGSPKNVQIGITVGRALGGAVDRNRIKRRMRDCVRHCLGTLQSALTEKGISAEIVINPKRSALNADIAKLRDEVRRGFAAIASANPGVGAGANRSR